MKRGNSQRRAQKPRNIRFIVVPKNPVPLIHKALWIPEMKRGMKREGNEGNAELGKDAALT